MAYKRILLDIETQRDFFVPGGSCYSRRSGPAARYVRMLFAWARVARIPILTTLLRVRRRDRGPLARAGHCVEGTDGERKIPGTIVRSRINLGIRSTTDLPVDIFEKYQQVIVEKRHTDIFAHARIERLLSELDDATFVVCGAGVAGGIVQAAIGLRARGFGVILATDAVLDLGHELAPMAVSRMEAKGVIFAPTAKIVAPRPRRPAVPLRRQSMRAKK